MLLGREAAVFVALVSMLAAPGCTASGGGSVDEASWIGTAWRVEEIEGARVPAEIEVTLAFPEPGRVAGLAACNRYMGSLELDGNRVVAVGPLASTRRMCPPEVMDQEQRMLAALPRAARLAREGDSLTVFGADDGPALLRLTRDTSAQPSP